jgi:DNA-directed RNA polymerase I subunit RPA1
VAANEQFTVPTDGKPLRGLIQDHIVGAVLLTKRDTFLDRATFCQLLYSACGAQFLGSRKFPGGGLVMTPEEHITVPPPAVLKPKPLWTGKQVTQPQQVTLGSGRKTSNNVWKSGHART